MRLLKSWILLAALCKVQLAYAGQPVITQNGAAVSHEVEQFTMAIIRANLNQIRHCYEILSHKSPKASGLLEVEFVITDAGRVNSASITKDTLKESTLDDCVLAKIQRWVFPRPKNGLPITVRFPYTFNPL